MVLFWVFVIVGVVYLVRWLMRQGIADRPESSLDILKKRYARGEISKQEFEEMRQDLQV
uniref:SHOCT domain-containing protein n=1 Tax=Nitrospira cf. moscoviensis SBR1015 TaxID=96242 RepID=UPI000B3BD12F|nr:SHOCT domain-containing protein [Nitrospira cf. moscoviensis SBR1015]